MIHTEATNARSLRQYRAHTINKDGVKIIRIGRDLVHVFTNTGWTNHSRYRVSNGRWSYLSGVRLSASVIQSLLPDVR